MISQCAAALYLILSQACAIQLAGVQYILDTVVAALAANPDRKFTYADMVCDAAPLLVSLTILRPIFSSMMTMHAPAALVQAKSRRLIAQDTCEACGKWE